MKNWSDERILDYLMTSDFDDNLSPEDAKFLLTKFRYFYRIVAGRSTSIEMEKRRFDFEIEVLRSTSEEKINQLTDNNKKLIDIYQSLTSRKLSFLERLLGKLKPKNNEIPEI